MHDPCRGGSVPENVELVTEEVDDLSFDAERFESPFATIYHPDSPGRRCSTY